MFTLYDDTLSYRRLGQMRYAEDKRSYFINVLRFIHRNAIHIHRLAVKEYTDKVIVRRTVQISAGIVMGYVLYKSARKTYSAIHFMVNNHYEVAERTRQFIGIGYYSRLIDLLSSEQSYDFRSLFRRTSVNMLEQELKGHSHPQAWYERSVANELMNRFIAITGYTKYSVSMSKLEQQDGTDGVREYHHAKDLQQHYQHDNLTGKHIIEMCDVDYYVDIRKYLKGNNLILYTFVPTNVAGTTTNGTYRVIEGSLIEMHITGGANYVHPIWDFESDHCVVDHYFWGIPFYSSFYLIEQKYVSPDRRIIYFQHIRNVYTPLGALLTGFRLRHRRMQYGNIVYIKSTTVDVHPEVVHSFANILENTSATIKDKILVSVRGRLAHVAKPVMSDVERIVQMEQPKVPDTHVVACILYQVSMNPVLSSLIIDRTHAPISKFEPGDNAYLPIGKNVYEDGSPTMRQISPPYLLDGCHPLRSENSDIACIKNRLTDVKNPNKPLPASFHGYIDEFIQLLVPDDVANTLVPHDYSYVYDKWKRPAQRSLLEQVKHILYLDKPIVIKSFQKAEVYKKVRGPRNICTVRPEHNARIAQFAYPFAEHIMKKQHWYAFGQHPQEIATDLIAIAATSENLIELDVNVMDGSTGEPASYLLETSVTRAYAIQYKGEVHKLLITMRSVKGWTSFHVQFGAINITVSGWLFTTIRNTLLVACIVFICWRIMGLSPQDAYDKLAKHGGDDATIRDINVDLLVQVFAKFGLTVKISVISTGMPFNFLGRTFLDPWTTKESIADVPRQLRKLHMTATPKNIPKELILYRKAQAYMITDPCTPVLGEWARAVIRILHDTIDASLLIKYENILLRDISYWANFENPFVPLTSYELAESVVAQQMGGHMQIQLAEMKFSEAKTLDDLCILMDDTYPKIAIPAAMGGILHQPNVVEKSQAQQLKEGLKLKPILKKNAQTTRTGRPDKTVKVAPKTDKKTDNGKRATMNPLCRFAARGRPCERVNCTFAHN